MAAAVWKTVEKFGLTGWVQIFIFRVASVLKFNQITAFVMDNATNNDTMVEAFARQCKNKGFNLSVKDGWRRCMPHTIHLSALKVYALPTLSLLNLLLIGVV
jgi:hypothetical protein